MTGYEATIYQFGTPQHHASIEEYTSFVHEYTANVSRRRDLLRAYERFTQCYPNLHDWFLAPLTERLGRINGEMKHSVCYEARTYLKFLALQGYAQFDWDWLIATRNLDLKNLTRHFELDFGLSQMREEAAHLGYTHGNVHHMLMWVMCQGRCTREPIENWPPGYNELQRTTIQNAGEQTPTTKRQDQLIPTPTCPTPVDRAPVVPDVPSREAASSPRSSCRSFMR